MYRHAAPGWTPQTRLVKINNPLHIETSRQGREEKSQEREREREVTRRSMRKKEDDDGGKCVGHSIICYQPLGGKYERSNG